MSRAHARKDRKAATLANPGEVIVVNAGDCNDMAATADLLVAALGL